MIDDDYQKEFAEGIKEIEQKGDLIEKSKSIKKLILDLCNKIKYMDPHQFSLHSLELMGQTASNYNELIKKYGWLENRNMELKEEIILLEKESMILKEMYQTTLQDKNIQLDNYQEKIKELEIKIK